MTRVTVRLPTELLDAVDARLVRRGEPRSVLIRRLLEEALLEVEERQEIERYVQGYREQPQIDEEVGWPETESLWNLAEQPWGPGR
jgi:metal-responsive CopG/Arc/MetJ family transcriptional regulator